MGELPSTHRATDKTQRARPTTLTVTVNKVLRILRANGLRAVLLIKQLFVVRQFCFANDGVQRIPRYS